MHCKSVASITVLKLKNSKHSYTFQDYFTTPSNVHHYSSRSKPQLTFYVPKLRLVRFQKSFKCRGVKIWNSIEQDLKMLSLKKFCKKYKNILLESC